MKKKIVNMISVAILILFSFIIGGSVSEFLRGNEKEPFQAENLTDLIKQLQENYNSFKSMSGAQLLDMWNQLFHDAEYKLDGKMRKKEFDCGGAETTFWNALGANVVYENTEMKEQRLQRLGPAYKKIVEIVVGDIIIFKRDGDYGHIAIIHRVNKKTLSYMDMNVKDDGPGYNTIEFTDPRIQGVYAMSFDYFAGDILNKINKK